MTGLRYVYAVCRPLDAPLQAQITGVAGVPPALLNHHGLVAVVSRVPEADFGEETLHTRLEDPDWRAATARAHEGVIDALTTVTTPLPLPLGTVFRDDSAVRVMIESREDEFRRTLHRLRDRAEWGVRLYADSESAGAVRRGEECARTLHERLCRHAEDCRLHTPRHTPPPGAPGRTVLDAAYLVPRTHCEQFVEVVERTKSEEPGMRVELSGPWAPYSFTGEEP
jgi:hypothetical protein